jgi:hypothetical protein
LEALLSGGKLPSRRQHKTDPSKSALQTIMGEVDELSAGSDAISNRHDDEDQSEGDEEF